MTASVDRAGLCEGCGAPRRRGQRYCLDCGARAGLRSPQLQELLRRVQERCRAEDPSVLDAPAGLDPAAGAAQTADGRALRRRTGLSLPSPRVRAVLVLAFLGFGVLIGDVAASPVKDTSTASAGRRVKLVLPPVASPASTANPSGSGAVSESPSSTGEAPPAAAEPSPSAGASSPAAGEARSGSSPSSSQRSGSGGSGGGEGGSSPPAAGGSTLPPVKHVFVIMLSDQPYASVFGPSSASPYLYRTLERRGELLVRYYAVAHQQLADEIALLSGQGPTPETAANCPVYADILPATIGAYEQVGGDGCVYPPSTKTLFGQLAAKHLPWRAYVEGMAEGPGAESGAADGSCGHPALGTADPTTAASPPDGQTYATWLNPFVYFGSLVDAPACEAEDVGLNALSADLSSPRRTPSFAYVVPDRCHDANPTPCAPGAPAGLPAAEPFLERVVPEIMSSSAYKEGGLLVITVDQAPSSGELADSSSCCGQPQFPNLPASTSGLAPEGGGQVGALLLSPFIRRGVNHEPYNHFSLLRTIEELFGVSHLGYAALPEVSSFKASIFSRSN